MGHHAVELRWYYDRVARDLVDGSDNVRVPDHVSIREDIHQVANQEAKAVLGRLLLLLIDII
jgi:hypothetical protein